LSGYDDSLISSLLIIAAVKASGIDQPVNVFFAKKLARHSISDSACRISKCDQARSVPACNVEFHVWNHRDKAVMFYFAAIKVQVMAATQWLFSTIN